MRKRKNIKKNSKANWFFEKTHIIVAYRFDQEEKQEKLPNYQLWNCKRDKISKCCRDILKDPKPQSPPRYNEVIRRKKCVLCY